MLIVLIFASKGWAAEEAKPRVQIAILLDTSNSMDGLIAQAKTQLWKIVNEFAVAKRDGQRPDLEVALYEYGKTSLPARKGYLRMILPFTTDLDKVSEELFALKTNGGNEYCGKVIKAATEELAWSSSNDDFKAIFIAGNEPFTQGDVDYRKACPLAIRKGIIVNTIFCGSYEEGVGTKWKDGADLADGKYMNIDQNLQTVHIEAPQDKEITRLGEELNKTYIAYGAQGRVSQERQQAQDMNAKAAAPGSVLERSVSKASGFYRNESWDIVDAQKAGKIKVEELKKEDLPEEMQKMREDERKAYIEDKAKEREKIQAEINKLNEERKKYVAEEMKKQSQSGANTLETAVIQTIRDQAAKKNFKFE
jgi:hypothetical protein